jgi:hypothetical protein
MSGLPITVSESEIDFGTLAPGESGQRALIVSGGPGRASSEMGLFTVEPSKFGPEETTLNVSTSAGKDGQTLADVLLLDSDDLRVRVNVQAKWDAASARATGEKRLQERIGELEKQLMLLKGQALALERKDTIQRRRLEEFETLVRETQRIAMNPASSPAAPPLNLQPIEERLQRAESMLNQLSGDLATLSSSVRQILERLTQLDQNVRRLETTASSAAPFPPPSAPSVSALPEKKNLKPIERLMQGLPGLAERVRSEGALSRDQLTQIMTYCGLNESWALEVLEGWMKILLFVRGSSDPAKKEGAIKLFTDRNVPEGLARTAVEMVAAPPVSSPTGAAVLPISVSANAIQFGWLPPGIGAQKTIVVTGGPGRALSSTAMVTVSPGVFGPGPTTLVLTLQGGADGMLLDEKLILETESELIQLAMTALWSSQNR